MEANRENEPIPSGQVFSDNIFLLLVLGIVVPTVVYTVWGLWEIMNVPQLPLVP